MNPIVKILMERDGLTEQEANHSMRIAHGLLLQGEDPEEVLDAEFGLEPDYVFDLIEGMHEVAR